MVPMTIVVRVGLGLAYQGASSTPYHRRDYHDASSSAPSSGRRNNGQLSTFRAASHQDDNGLQSISLGSSSSGTKLDIASGKESDSRVAGDDSYDTDRNSRREDRTV